MAHTFERPFDGRWRNIARTLSASLLCLVGMELYATEEDVLINKINDPDIKTVILQPVDQPQEPAVLSLKNNQQLELIFDDLSNEVRDLSYTFQLCNADWTPNTSLVKTRYIDGFQSDYIQDYGFSFNTLIPYINYRLVFPNDQLSLTKSGNYVVKVFPTGQKDSLLFQQRFMIVENAASISPELRVPSRTSDREYRQEIDFDVNLQNLNLANAYGDVQAAVLQNRRWDNALTGLKPQFVKGNVLSYDYTGKIVFDGNNEYRYFNITSTRFRSEQVKDIYMTPEEIYAVDLAPMPKRSFKEYVFYQDINGQFRIRNVDMEDPLLEADYLEVNFTLPSGGALPGQQIYIFGELTMNRLLPDFQMKYNIEKDAYTATVLLKQGYYNYVYAVSREGTSAADVSEVEGTHFETENEYTILVYYRDRQTQSDRIIGYRRFSTNDQN